MIPALVDGAVTVYPEVGLGVIAWVALGALGGFLAEWHLYRKFPEQGFSPGMPIVFGFFGPFGLAGYLASLLMEWKVGANRS